MTRNKVGRRRVYSVMRPALAPLVRRGLASASMAAVAAMMAAEAWHATLDRGLFLSLAGVAGGAAVLIGSKRLLSQVLGRAVAWLFLLPTAAYLVAMVLGWHRPEMAAVALALSSGGALVCSSARLRAGEARREFDPVAHRGTFLAGATAAAAVGVATCFVGLAELAWSSRLEGTLVLGLGAAFLATTLGVLRMRAWGVLLGMTLAVACTVIAAFSTVGMLALPMAFPGFLLAYPLFAVRLTGARQGVQLRPPVAQPGIQRRIEPVGEHSRSTHVRVATDTTAEWLGEESTAANDALLDHTGTPTRASW